MASSALLTCSCVLFLLLSYRSHLANGEEAQRYHVVQRRSLNPGAVCSSLEGSNVTSLRLVSRYGPCSPFEAKELPSLEQILLKDQLRANYLLKGVMKSSTKSQLNDSMASIPAEYGGWEFVITVNYILKGVAKSQLNDSMASIPAEYGGEYVITVGYGTPSREQTVTMDTGSDLSWIQCKPCSACYSQQQPIFDPSQSSSYATIPCNSPDCSQHQGSCSSSCAYNMTYGDGSSSSGVYSYDRLTLSPTDVIETFLFGCGTDNNLLFKGAAGILGLSRGILSLVSQTSQIYHSVFSYCLPSTPNSIGFLKLGEPGDASNTVYTRMLTSSNRPSFYFVDLIGISVAGQQLAIPPSVFRSGGTIMDSGTVITRLPPSAYEALRSAFQEHMSAYPRKPPKEIFDTCYDFSGYETKPVPTNITLHFGDGATLDVDSSGILFDDCLAFSGMLIYGLGIIGNVQQRTYEVVYDVGNVRIGFAPHACS